MRWYYMLPFFFALLILIGVFPNLKRFKHEPPLTSRKRNSRPSLATCTQFLFPVRPCDALFDYQEELGPSLQCECLLYPIKHIPFQLDSTKLRLIKISNKGSIPTEILLLSALYLANICYGKPFTSAEIPKTFSSVHCYACTERKGR